MATTKSRDRYIAEPSPIETELKTFFDKNAPLVIFDIGSCEGEDSIRYARLFPRSHIYAVEPLPKNIDRMKALLEKYSVSNVEIVPLALSDRSGKATFYVSSGQREDYSDNLDWDFGNKSSSLLPPDEALTSLYPWLHFDETVEVDTEALKNFCTRRGIHRIDYVHMDVQGAEYQVLRGFEELIQSTVLIWLEVSATTLYKNQAHKSEIEEFMSHNGFLKLKDTVGETFGDQLYFNKRYFNDPFPMPQVIYLLLRAKFRQFVRGMIRR